MTLNILKFRKSNERFKSSKKLSSGDGLGFEISDFSDIDIQSDTYVDMLLFSMPKI